MDVQGTITFWLIIIIMGIPTTHFALGYIPKTPQQSTQVCGSMPFWHNFQIHLSMPHGTCGILSTKTWVPTQPFDISINPTNPMNTLKRKICPNKSKALPFI
jgi:hypothetical protein